MIKRLLPVVLVGLCILLIPFTAQSEGIPLQKDVLLGSPIFGPEDLPEEITFTLYDSQTATTPLGYQTFTRGQYTVDFEFSKSDGITSGNVARVSADFTKTLNLKDAEGEAIQPKEIWAGIEVGGAEIGDRTKVSDGTLVQLLLASDASIATYLTLAYTGDSNPIATIYKDLPISSLSSDGSESSLSNYFNAVVTGASEGLIEPNGLSGTNDWFPMTTGNGIYYNYGIQRKVGIGTTTPDASFEVMATAPTMGLSAPGYTDFFSMFGGSVANQNPFFAWSRGPLRFGTATSPAGAGWSEKVRIMSDGKVGIGTTTPAYLLDVAGEVRFGDKIRFGSAENFYDGGNNLIATDDSLYVGNRIGIGTKSPSAGLHIKRAGFPNSFAYFDTTGVDQDAGMRFYENGVFKGHLYHDASANNLELATGAAALYLNTTSGNVGIGKTNPGYKLDVAGGDIALENNQYIRFQSSAGTYLAGMHMSTTDYLYMANNAAGGRIGLVTEGATGIAIGNSAENRKVFVTSLLTANGPVYVNAGTLTTTNPSSLEYKENIEPIDLKPQRLLELKPMSYNWKSNEKEDFGYIAEDVKEVLPELYQDDGMTKGYDVAKLPVYIIELLKEQQVAIDSLKAEVAALKNQMGLEKLN